MWKWKLAFVKVFYVGLFLEMDQLPIVDVYLRLNFLAYQIVIILAKTRYLNLRACSDLRYKQHSYKNTGARWKATPENWDQSHLQIIDPSMANQLAKCILDSGKNFQSFYYVKLKKEGVQKQAYLHMTSRNLQFNWEARP